jgi:exodeoxyribonuclease-5
LQVKFNYAVTCHKAQGGQWPVVFIDQGYLQKDQIDVGFIRWLYTAITRAREKVYLINFSEDFFDHQ